MFVVILISKNVHVLHVSCSLKCILHHTKFHFLQIYNYVLTSKLKIPYEYIYKEFNKLNKTLLTRTIFINHIYNDVTNH